MNIYAEPGSKVKFTNEGGYEYQRSDALKLLTVGQTYTVKRTVVHSWSTETYLVEVPDVSFNSVQFEDVE